ncbi:MAG: hypothetical protein KC620_18975, partial [Myxococcales bacterium]|nr:hypothetical protein [Myxococcales bacterium]
MILLPTGYRERMALDVPADARIDAPAALLLLGELIGQRRGGLMSLKPVWPEVRAFARHVEARSRGWYMEFEVGTGRDRVILSGATADAARAHFHRLDCQRCHLVICEHRLAVGLSLAWHS